jgi:hypothetical protein
MDNHKRGLLGGTIAVLIGWSPILFVLNPDMISVTGAACMLMLGFPYWVFGYSVMYEYVTETN